MTIIPLKLDRFQAIALQIRKYVCIVKQMINNWEYQLISIRLLQDAQRQLEVHGSGALVFGTHMYNLQG